MSWVSVNVGKTTWPENVMEQWNWYRLIRLRGGIAGHGARMVRDCCKILHEKDAHAYLRRMNLGCIDP
jgi:hypothetical protein